MDKKMSSMRREDVTLWPVDSATPLPAEENSGHHGWLDRQLGEAEQWRSRSNEGARTEPLDEASKHQVQGAALRNLGEEWAVRRCRRRCILLHPLVSCRPLSHDCVVVPLAQPFLAHFSSTRAATVPFSSPYDAHYTPGDLRRPRSRMRCAARASGAPWPALNPLLQVKQTRPARAVASHRSAASIHHSRMRTLH